MQAHRFAHQLSFCRVDAHLAVSPGWIFVRSAYNGCLCRPAGVEKQRRGRFDQLHAQYRAERRNLGCNYVACTPRSIPSVRSRRVHTLSSVRCGRRRLGEPSDTCRFEHARRPATGACQTVQRGDGTGSSTLLRRYLLAARSDLRADVSVVFPTSQKRTRQGRPGCCPLSEPMPDANIQTPQWLSQMENILEELNEGVAIADDHLRVIFANEALVRLWRYDRAEILGRTPDAIFPAEDLPFIMRQHEWDLRYGRHRYEFYLPRKDGQKIPAIFSERVIEGRDGHKYH